MNKRKKVQFLPVEVGTIGREEEAWEGEYSTNTEYTCM
jgi:hypothetical protein